MLCGVGCGVLAWCRKNSGETFSFVRHKRYTAFYTKLHHTEKEKEKKREDVHVCQMLPLYTCSRLGWHPYRQGCGRDQDAGKIYVEGSFFERATKGS